MCGITDFSKQGVCMESYTQLSCNLCILCLGEHLFTTYWWSCLCKPHWTRLHRWNTNMHYRWDGKGFNHITAWFLGGYLEATMSLMNKGNDLILYSKIVLYVLYYTTMLLDSWIWLVRRLYRFYSNNLYVIVSIVTAHSAEAPHILSLILKKLLSFNKDFLYGQV